jgi:hypothetical protein
MALRRLNAIAKNRLLKIQVLETRTKTGLPIRF